MKGFLRILLLSAVFACALPALTCAQAKINTKKVKIAGLSTHTTKVVLGGNDLIDSALKDAITSRWRISPYEFCTVGEYNRLKEDPDYYFLLIASSGEKRFEGLLTLTLMKGGKAKSDDPQKKRVDVASLPLCAAEFPSGREMVFLPALVDILQDYTEKAMASDNAGYKGFDIYARNVRSSRSKQIRFSEDDLAPDLGIAFMRKHFDADMSVVEEEDADKAFLDGEHNTLVSYVVAPFDPKNGSYCYKMLIDAENYGLYYFSHHRISTRKWAGFLPGDIKKIAAHR